MIGCGWDGIWMGWVSVQSIHYGIVGIVGIGDLEGTSQGSVTGVRFLVLINRHTYAYGIWEGIGVCIGVPAKRRRSQDTTDTAKKGR